MSATEGTKAIALTKSNLWGSIPRPAPNSMEGRYLGGLFRLLVRNRYERRRFMCSQREAVVRSSLITAASCCRDSASSILQAACARQTCWTSIEVCPKRTNYAGSRTRIGSSRDGAPGGIRTPDQWLRKPLLYPAELRARGVKRAGMGHPRDAGQRRTGSIAELGEVRPRMGYRQSGPSPQPSSSLLRAVPSMAPPRVPRVRERSALDQRALIN
jgi:hypothetical protein